MTRLVLGAALAAASCVLPSVELVDSLGSAGASRGGSAGDGGTSNGGTSDGGDGNAGDGTGGAQPNGGSSGSSGSGGSPSNGGSTGDAGAGAVGGGEAAGAGGVPGDDCPEEQPAAGETCAEQQAECNYVGVMCSCEGTWTCGADWTLWEGGVECHDRLPLAGTPCADGSGTCEYTPLDNCTVYTLECSTGQWTILSDQGMPDEGADCDTPPLYCIGDSGTDCVCTGLGWSCGDCADPVGGDSCDSDASDIICDDGVDLCFCVEGGPQDQTWACN